MLAEKKIIIIIKIMKDAVGTWGVTKADLDRLDADHHHHQITVYYFVDTG